MASRMKVNIKAMYPVGQIFISQSVLPSRSSAKRRPLVAFACTINRSKPVRNMNVNLVCITSLKTMQSEGTHSLKFLFA